MMMFNFTGIMTGLMAFSIHKNTAKLLKISPPSKDHLACLDGIRFLSITWVMIGHWLGITWWTFKANNLLYFSESLQGNWWGQVIHNAVFSVDTFFLLSACLVTYLSMKELDKNKGSINVPLFYIHRYLRY